MTRQGRECLRQTSWSYLLGISNFLMVLAAIATVGAERGGTRMRVANLLLLSALGLVVAKLGVDGYGGLGRYRAAAAAGAPWLTRLAALAPRLLVAQARMDSAHLAAFAAWIRRRPLAEPAPGRRFGFQQRSSYSTLIILALMAILIDLPITTMLASVMSKDPALQLRIHLAMGALTLYSLLWLLGDRRLMQGSTHLLDGETLRLAIAGRLRAQIPLTAIAGGDMVAGTAPEWCKRQGVPLHAALCVRASPFDQPNLALFLAAGTGAQLTQWQLARPAPRVLLLHVDEPAQLLATLFPTQQKD